MEEFVCLVLLVLFTTNNIIVNNLHTDDMLADATLVALCAV